MTEYRIEEAAQRREQAEAALYRSDGTKVFGDAEHRERLANIRAEHARAFDAIDADVGRKVREAEEALLVAENRDPADALLPSELQRANAKSQFVADDVGRLPLDALEKRCRAALASGDKANIFLWAHHAGRRADEEGAHELAETVAELRAKLDPDAERKLAEARQAHEDAMELRELAYFKRRGVSDAVGLYHQQTYGHLAQGVWGG